MDSNQKYVAQALGLQDGQAPFDWQMRLFHHFMKGLSPAQSRLSLDLPTGLGKTSVMALWLAASLSKAREGYLPRRLVYVVDRRAVVDQSTTVAESLRKWAETEHGHKLPISTLRGQFVDNREWMEDPAAHGIIVGTVDMIGSRLLFEGYGVSRNMRPYAAALLGTDVLFILDESHLTPSFERLLETISEHKEWRQGKLSNEIVPGFHLLSLSATGGDKQGGEVFRLHQDDLQHPTVKKRVKASKLLQLIDVPTAKQLPEELARRSWDLAFKHETGGSVLVFCNSRKDALKVKGSIENRAKNEEVELGIGLFTGARRVREREKAFAELEQLGFLAGPTTSSKTSILVATSAAEVGVDLDANHMVCDLVQWERMVQRLGRVNRRGEGRAEVHVIAALDTDNVHDLRAPLRALRPTGHGFDASPEALGALRDNPSLKEVLKKATSTAPFYPQLTLNQLQAWSMTSIRDHSGRPKVEPWLRGWRDRDEPQTSLVWREHLPICEDASPRLVQKFFEAAPPHLSEKLQTSTDRAMAWLQDRAKRHRKETEGKGALELQGFAYVLDSAGELALDKPLTLEQCSTENRRWLEPLLAGATLVVDKRFGGLDQDGYLEEKAPAEGLQTADSSDWLPQLPFLIVRTGYAEKPQPVESVLCQRFPLAKEDDETTEELLVFKRKNAATFEDARSANHWQGLTEHQELASKKADAMSETLSLPETYRLMLSRAALLHDEGKALPQWQRAFRAKPDKPYAKTPGPIDQKVLGGYRHEFGSYFKVQNQGMLADLDSASRELALHLIAAHHGLARPFTRTEGCSERPSLLQKHARDIALRFFELQEEWGPWGLAWWESLLRAADQQASRELSEGAGDGN